MRSRDRVSFSFESMPPTSAEASRSKGSVTRTPCSRLRNSSASSAKSGLISIGTAAEPSARRATSMPAEFSQAANRFDIAWRTVSGESSPSAFLSGSNSFGRLVATTSALRASGSASKMKLSNLTALGRSGGPAARARPGVALS